MKPILAQVSKAKQMFKLHDCLLPMHLARDYQYILTLLRLHPGWISLSERRVHVIWGTDEHVEELDAEARCDHQSAHSRHGSGQSQEWHQSRPHDQHILPKGEFVFIQCIISTKKACFFFRPILTTSKKNCTGDGGGGGGGASGVSYGSLFGRYLDSKKIEKSSQFRENIGLEINNLSF